MFFLNSKYLKVAAVFMAVEVFTTVVAPSVSYALTSGPSTPEVQSFEAATTTEMVDLFSGDFTYNIPLFELPGPNGGYPFNLHYNANISPDQEASWVGLGWNLNPGAINRQMRGIPDEFKGTSDGNDDWLEVKQDIKDNVTVGIGGGVAFEIFGSGNLIGLGGEASIRLYYNSYKGTGYSLTVGLEPSFNGDYAQPGLGLNLSLDNNEGVSSEVSLSLSRETDKVAGGVQLGIGMNSRVGLTDISTGVSSAKVKVKGVKGGQSNLNDPAKRKRVQYKNFSSGSNASFYSGGYSPNVSMPMASRSFNINMKIGAEIFGIFPSGKVFGDFSITRIRDKNQAIKSHAYGYNFLDKVPNRQDDDFVMDFNREQDGTIRHNTPLLPIPILNNDIYTLTAQGAAGSFRAYRNDAPVVCDPKTTSNSLGLGVGLEVGVGNAAKAGFNGSITYGQTFSGYWPSSDGNGNTSGTSSASFNSLFEPYYFKSYGEQTTDPKDELNDEIYGVEPLKADRDVFNVTDKWRKDNTTTDFDNQQVISSETREKRNQVLGYINNDPTKGMYSIQPNGTRYFYGKVAKNTSHKEVTKSIAPKNPMTNEICDETAGIGNDHKRPGTNMFLKESSMSSYAYSYLLTEVVGPDYIDITGNGVSEDDLGYWVKFTYADSIPMVWKAPFTNGNYIKGQESSTEDDLVSYMQGRKNVHYLSRVETKTHQADFTLSPRRDGYDDVTGNRLMQLDKIVLKSKKDPTVPIKTMEFTYEYSLCKQIPNYYNVGETEPNPEKRGGKLTLTQVAFYHKNNIRDKFNPYEFSYEGLNPNYETYTNDRWGNYKSYQGESQCNIRAFPYTRQYNYSNPQDGSTRNSIDQQSAAWSLTKIKLPSGGEIKVKYESDDYAYVQDKRAAIMLPIAALGNTDEGNERTNVKVNTEKSIVAEDRKIYFPLNKSFPDTEQGAADASDLVDEYCVGLDYLYYKIHSKLKDQNGSSNDFYEDLRGYAKIEEWGVDDNCKAGGIYDRGFIQIAFQKKSPNSSRAIEYHPFALSAWQFLKTENPKLIGMTRQLDVTGDEGSSAAINHVVNFYRSNPLKDLKSVFFSYYKTCSDAHWGGEITGNGRSFIRLNHPDKIKIGGGLRVKEIVFDDNWDEVTSSASEKGSVYGQVYDYTVKEGNRVISSGVAAYEPQVGGDENALKRPIEYAESVPMLTNNRLFCEEPYNESYYPAANVGYSKVTVKSLASHYSEIASNDHNIPSGILTSGAVVHEFYTAKEFPVITYRSWTDPKKDNFPFIIPSVGTIGKNLLTITQGYTIILNDMHGKLKKVSSYRSGPIEDANVISYVEYKYQEKPISKQNGEVVSGIDEVVKVLVSDKYGQVVTGDRSLGVDYEFFSDQRHYRSFSVQGGAAIDGDGFFLFIPLFFPTVWPICNYSTTHLKMVVSNKVISKSGILKEIIASDGQSKVSTKNLLYDDMTGRVVLSSVTNNFDNPIYSYELPAHQAYKRTGQAYLNLDFTIEGKLEAQSTTNLYRFVPASGVDVSPLVLGDELVSADGKKIIIEKKLGGDLYCSTSTPFTTSNKILRVSRSGYRNMLESSVSTIKTLGNKDDQKGSPIKF